MFAARVLLPASFFNVRTSFAVHARLFILRLLDQKNEGYTSCQAKGRDIDLNQIAFLIFVSPQKSWFAVSASLTRRLLSFTSNGFFRR